MSSTTKCASQTVSVHLVSFKHTTLIHIEFVHTIHVHFIFRTDKNEKKFQKAINFIGCWFYIFISPLRIIQLMSFMYVV